MKHAYRWMRPLLAALLLFAALGTHAQQPWRPFRPGLIYMYEVPGSSSGGMYITAGIYTLRLDSAYCGSIRHTLRLLAIRPGLSTGYCGRLMTVPPAIPTHCAFARAATTYLASACCGSQAPRNLP